jgi:hypothetical protein
MRPIVLRLLFAAAGLLAIEAAFRLGAWDALVPPQSHAGTTIRMRDAVRSHTDRIDIVTLGSSRAEYGLDHAALAAAAKQRGLVHANLSMPGSHWMTILEQSRWLRRERPEVQGVVIALSAADMTWRSNGTYELAIVQPIRSAWSLEDEVRFRFDRNDLNTYGVYSALFGYRQSVQFALQSPRELTKALTWFRRHGRHPLFDGPHIQHDLCGLPMATVDACAKASPAIPEQQTPIDQCKSLLPSVGASPDWRTLTADTLTDERRALIELRQAQIRAMDWPKPPVIVLMPITHVWRKELMPQGAIAWSHLLLDPLAESGDIVLIDLSTALDEGDETRCDYFFDLYHQNDLGARTLTQQLLPQIESALYTPLQR